MSPGRRPTSVRSDILIHSAVWPQQTRAKKWGRGCCAPFGGESGSSSNRMSPGPRPTSVPSGILIAGIRTRSPVRALTSRLLYVTPCHGLGPLICHCWSWTLGQSNERRYSHLIPDYVSSKTRTCTNRGTLSCIHRVTVT